MRFGSGQLVFDFFVGLDLAVLVHILQFAIDVSRLRQGRRHLVFTHENIGLPFVKWAVLVGVLGLYVVNGGQVAVTPVVVHGKRGRLVVGRRVGAAKGIGNHRSVSGEVQA